VSEDVRGGAWLGGTGAGPAEVGGSGSDVEAAVGHAGADGVVVVSIRTGVGLDAAKPALRCRSTTAEAERARAAESPRGNARQANAR
jgi:hypothetical protein